MKEKIQEILEELKDGAENSTVIYATFDGSDEEEFENDKLLTPESCKLLFNYITQLQNNWNELKKWLEEEIKQYDNVGLKFKKQGNFECASRSYDYLKQYQTMLSKIQELEGKSE